MATASLGGDLKLGVENNPGLLRTRKLWRSISFHVRFMRLLRERFSVRPEMELRSIPSEKKKTKQKDEKEWCNLGQTDNINRDGFLSRVFFSGLFFSSHQRHHSETQHTVSKKFCRNWHQFSHHQSSPQVTLTVHSSDDPYNPHACSTFHHHFLSSSYPPDPVLHLTRMNSSILREDDDSRFIHDSTWV